MELPQVAGIVWLQTKYVVIDVIAPLVGKLFDARLYMKVLQSKRVGFRPRAVMQWAALCSRWLYRIWHLQMIEANLKIWEFGVRARKQPLAPVAIHESQ